MKTNFLGRLVLIFGYIFLFSEMIGGVLRYFFDRISMPFFVYVPKFLLLLGMLILIFFSLYRMKLSLLWAILGCVILTSICVGFAYVGNLSQVLFGAWAILPFFYGVLISNVIKKFTINRFYFYILWLVGVMGVLFTYFFQSPWVGYQYAIGDFSVQAAREWWTFGIARLPGFSRASFEVAIQLLLLGMILMCLERKNILKIIVWLVSGFLIVLTTTKTVAGIWLFLTIFYLTGALLREKVQLLSRVIVLGLTLIAAFLPFWGDDILSISLESQLLRFLFSSFLERVLSIWPAVIELVTNNGSIVLGRGLGGIGAAQMYFEIGFLPGDNLALYLYAISGVLGLLLFLGYGMSCTLVYRGQSRYFILMFYFTLAVLLEGLTVNVLESPFFGMVFGLTLGFWYNQFLSSLRIVNAGVHG